MTYNDEASWPAWAADAIRWAADAGLMTGFPEDNTWRPHDPVTRAQLVTVLGRYDLFIGERIDALDVDVLTRLRKHQAVIESNHPGSFPELPGPPPTPPPPPPPPPPPTGVPWIIPTPTGYTAPPVVVVDLPQGTLGPTSMEPVDPAEAGAATFSNGLWTMRRDWDEVLDGGYLDFGKARVFGNGHTVDGFRITTATGGRGVVYGGDFRHGEIIGDGTVVDCINGVGGTSLGHSLILGVTGDVFKAGRGATLSVHDCFAWVRPDPDSAKHQDGLQVHDARTGAEGGHARLERVVIDWNDAGSVAGTTAAIFTQGSASLTADMVLLLRPGGTWGIMRMTGTGEHDLGACQVIGNRQPNVKDRSALAPTSLVWGPHRWGDLWNDVPGCPDYKDA